ncbi:MAG: hypothetical protein GY761_17460 [Hyphomicrobiales bacterium]|nr:hypothetical protein [Hyphomicrobiales bacterium]
MSETYLNGKISVTSLAAPTPEDIKKLRTLSTDDHKALLVEALMRGEESGISNKTVDDIWDSARQKAQKIKENQEYAL